MSILITFFAFFLAILVLVTVHEFGHYWVAKKSGVKVLKFSIGFGKVLYKKTIGETDFVISLIPLGGYVKMLDSREAEVPADQIHREFTNKSLTIKSLIVVAGPVANFILAILLYWFIFAGDITGIKPTVGNILDSSPAYKSGFRPGDTVLNVAGESVALWNDVRLELVKAGSVDKEAKVEVLSSNGINRIIPVDLSSFLLKPNSWWSDFKLIPDLENVVKIDKVIPNDSAEKYGLKAGDVFIAIDGVPINSTIGFISQIQQKNTDKPIEFSVLRAGNLIKINVVPKLVVTKGVSKVKIGIVFSPMEIAERYKKTIKLGLWGSLNKSIKQTWDFSKLTLVMIYKVITGDVAAKDSIGGPITIANIAGDSLLSGLISFLGFLAILSVSLGVLNLLPIPVLDGGHLLLYFIEFVKGKPLSLQTELMFQRVGMMLVYSLSLFAIYNDTLKFF